jgi:ADP-ribose pyrophosphatase
MADGLTPGAWAREADEFLELVPTPLSEALAMVGRGVIQDAKTALALLYTVQYVLPAGLAGGGGVSPK